MTHAVLYTFAESVVMWVLLLRTSLELAAKVKLRSFASQTTPFEMFHAATALASFFVPVEAAAVGHAVAFNLAYHVVMVAYSLYQRVVAKQSLTFWGWVYAINTVATVAGIVLAAKYTDSTHEGFYTFFYLQVQLLAANVWWQIYKLTGLYPVLLIATWKGISFAMESTLPVSADSFLVDFAGLGNTTSYALALYLGLLHASNVALLFRFIYFRLTRLRADTLNIINKRQGLVAPESPKKAETAAAAAATTATKKKTDEVTAPASPALQPARKSEESKKDL